MEEGFTGVDDAAIGDKFAPPEEHAQVLVIGAGPAGCAAALKAAQDGAQVVLVDENPVSGALMGLDAPLYFGGRMTTAVQRKERMLEQVFAANPALEPLIEAGVDLRLGVYAWGAYMNGPGVKSLPGPVVGLADEDTSWLIGFDTLILATGARDLSMAFPGWDQPGVMGAAALHSLLTRYDAFAGRRLVVLGSGELALMTAMFALERGLEVAAVVEVLDTVQGPAHLADALAARGVEIITGHTPQQAKGGIDGVEHLTLAPTDGGAAREIACDTVCMAVGLVPAVELPNVLGAALTVDPMRGGHVPKVGEDGATSLPGVFVVGDAAGTPGPDAHAYQTAWMRALLGAGGPEVVVCQCEEVSRGDLLGVQPPKYLERSEKMCARDLGGLVEDGPVDQDQIKRLTRAGMGVCQGRRCREQIALTLALATQTPVAAIPLAGYRAPVRPLPLRVMADWKEPAEMTAHWDVWFGIPTQWTPYQDIGTEREAYHRAVLGGNMHL